MRAADEARASGKAAAVPDAAVVAPVEEPALLPVPKASGAARRYESGVASNGGNLPLIEAGEDWLRGTSGNAGRIPQQIADKLAGQSFTSFDQFRETFWKAVADDPGLSQQFSAPNLARMQAGRAPFAVSSEQVGGRQVYELDHMQPVAQGGNVYDMNNIVVRTPLNHMKGK